MYVRVWAARGRQPALKAVARTHVVVVIAMGAPYTVPPVSVGNVPSVV
jgi:hypothetical protein